MTTRQSIASKARALADDIREYSRGQALIWQKILSTAEKRAKISFQADLNTKKGYLVFFFERERRDVLLDMVDGELYEVADGPFKHFLMNHHRVHPDMKPFLAKAGDEAVLKFATNTDFLDSRAIRELFAHLTNSVPLDGIDELEQRRWYSYDLFRNSEDPVTGKIVVILEDEKDIPKKEISEQPR